MSQEEKDNFYREKVFNEIFNRLDKIDDNMKIMDRKLTYIYGFAAAIGFGASFLFAWIKAKFVKS